MKGSVQTWSRGVGLVELMISVALGCFVCAALIDMYISNRRVHNLQQSLATIQEHSAFAVDYVRRSVMQAGSGLEGQAIFPVAIEFGQGDPTNKSQDGDLFDQLVIRMESGFDCVGDSLDQGAVKWKRFYVENNELFCRDSDRQTVGLVDNVQAFQVLYGVDTDRDGAVDRYVNAAGALGQEEYVFSVRVGFLLDSDYPVINSQISPQTEYFVLDERIAASLLRDGRALHRTFVASIALRPFS